MENITKSAYLLIDMQNGFLDPSSPLCSTAAKATVPACARTMDIARQKAFRCLLSIAGTGRMAAMWRRRATPFGPGRTAAGVWLPKRRSTGGPAAEAG